MKAVLALLGIALALSLFGCTQGTDQPPKIVSFESNPASDAYLVRVSASDDLGLKSVSASIGSNVQTFDCGELKTCSNQFAFSKLSNGNHTVQVNALDSSGQGASQSKQVTIEGSNRGELSEAEKVLESYGFFGAENVGETNLDQTFFNMSGTQWVKVHAFQNAVKPFEEPSVEWSGRKAFVVLSPKAVDANGGVSETEWKDFVRTTVKKYSKEPYNAQLYQLVEAPEYAQYWKDSNAEYAKLLRWTFEAVKSADSNAFVVLGSYVLDSISKRPVFHQAVAQYTFSDGKKGGEYFDIFALDYYTPTSSTKAKLQEISTQLHDWNADKPIIITSTGTNNSTLDELAVSKDLIQRLTTARALNIPMTQWYTFKDPSYAAIVSQEKGLERVGLVSSGGRARAGYYAFKFLAEQLKDIDSSETEILSEGKNSTYAYRFHKTNGNTITIAWNYSTQYANLNIPTTASSVKVLDLVADASGTFSESTVSTNNGTAVVQVKYNPLAILEQ